MSKGTSNDTYLDNKNNYIIGIGASAGGLEALQKFFSALPANTGFPYIVVQHLSPDYKSLLSEILSKYTDMPVTQVEDGVEIKPNCVYVIKPGKIMKLSGGRLMLSAQKERELNLPIDLFFKSLAEEAGSQAIAIIMSGTGSDGSNGIKSIKENDGMIIVQDPESAKFDGMPRSALRTGLIDAQLTPEEIAMELSHISTSSSKENIPMKTEKMMDEDLMKRIYYILKKVSNINFTHYKQTTIIRRIERRMMLTHKELLADYVEFLYESLDEVKILTKEVLIGVTSFFRDPEFFQALREKAVNNILVHSTPEEPIRIWVAGCSTGEEAYSIAIIFYEAMEALKIKRKIKIFATDLDVTSITLAGKGIYSENIIDTVSVSRLSRFFTRKNNAYVVNREIRQMIVFSPHNVFQDPPFGRLDLISCRNMLIYFQPVLQNDLFSIFHTSLKNGGYLFLGKSEAIGLYTDAYPVVDAAAKIFSHRSDVKIARAKVIPYLQTVVMDENYLDDETSIKHKVVTGEMELNEQNAIDNVLLEKFMPACLVVNERNELIHTYGESSNYIHFPIGKISNNLFDVITDSLKIPVSTLLKEVREKKQTVQYKDISFNGEREKAVINLTVMLVNKKAIGIDNYYALVFSEVKEPGEMNSAVPYEIDKVASQRITDLEQDLSEAQDKLKKSVAEQECVNEELQAANEELLTANEELQSSNEELQSVNEELYTVNSEYQSKLIELANMNDDIANFLCSTLIGIIFVDNKLSIRRYTDYVASEFSVMDHDIGRSLKFISYHFPTIDITEICDNVLKTLVPDEREVMTGKNKIFFMRVAPYRTTENKILGCVITLVDVTTQKQGQEILKNTEQQLNLAQQANEAKSDFMLRIEHEIQSPMSALVNLTDIAKGQVNNPESISKTLEQITDTVKYVSSIVSDISEMSKADVFIGNDNANRFQIREAIENASAVIMPRAKEGNLKFSINMASDYDPTYIGSKSRLQQILINFLNNAVKFTPKGGEISLDVSELSNFGNQVTVCFIIKDNGIGIGKDFLPDLFKPFTKENKTDCNGYSGMGLGLSIAYNLIKMMNGDVSVESKVGEGSKFTIHLLLERVTGNENVVNGKTISCDYNLTGRNILVVDDNRMNRIILNAVLAHEGMTYIEACDGEEAVKIFLQSAEYTFDCILMDIRMPNMDGIEATRIIRSSGKADAKTIPIIGVSANGFDEDMERAKQVKIDRYTTKPIDNNRLFSTISELIRERQMYKK